MNFRERIYSVLIVSGSEKFNASFSKMLPPSMYEPIHTTSSANEAKRCLAEKSFDFVIINFPLPDGSGTRLAIDCIRSQTTVVLVFVSSEVYYDIYDKVVDHGIFALSKPTSHSALEQALSWMASARERLRSLEKKTLSVEEKMEEIVLVNRAKCLLISELKMGESDAHHYIEKYAMDNCIPKRDAAQNIIRMYS